MHAGTAQPPCCPPSPHLINNHVRIPRTHRKLQHLHKKSFHGNLFQGPLSKLQSASCELLQSGAPFTPRRPVYWPAAPCALGTTWSGHTQAEGKPSSAPSATAAEAATAASALELINHIFSERVPCLAASCSHLLSSLASQSPCGPAGDDLTHQQRDAAGRAGEGPVGGDHTSGAQVLPADASLGAQWTDALHAWYSAWRALSSCVESLLILLPPGAAQARTSATRLLVRLGQMEQQLSGSSAVRRALDVSLASWHDVGLGRQSAASTSSTGRAHKCAGQLQPQPQQQQASQQQQRHVLRSGASAPRARSWSVMDRARAVRLCMQQGSYLPQDERAYSVVLSANEKQQVLEEYRDQERALLARAMSLLHSPAAAPEAEVSAKELQQDAVMAQLAQCVLPDHGGSVQLTLGACSFLLRHHPDTLIRQQVYELGVEGRCLQALQLLDQLADVRVKIARCCGHPSYDHLSHSGSLLGSSTAACALLAQLIQALKPPAQQQVLQHGRLAVVSAVAAAGGEGGGGSEGGGEGLGQHGGGEDAGWVEDVLLQSLDPSSLDYTPCGSVQRVGMAQGSPPAQHQQPPSLQALEQRQREQQPGRGGASELPPAPGAPPAPSAHVGLPPLASLLLGVSGLLRDSMGVWLELGPVPLVDIEGTGSPSGAAPEAAAAECSPARQQRHLLWHVLGRLQQPQGPGGQWGGAGQCAGSKQATLPQQQATQQATQDCGAPGRPEPSAFGAQQGGVIVAALHHEGLGCVGTLVIHATAACGTRYLCAEGTPRLHVAGRPSQQHEQPMVLIGLHGYPERGSGGEAAFSGHSGVANIQPLQAALQQAFVAEAPPSSQQTDPRLPDHDDDLYYHHHQQRQQQQQQQAQLQQELQLSGAALCLWELMHELGHAIHMLLSWQPMQAQQQGLAASWSNSRRSKSTKATSSSRSSANYVGTSTDDSRQINSQAESNASSSADSSRQNGSQAESITGDAFACAALCSCPSLLPLELLELPSTLLELMAAQPQCVAAILAGAQGHQLASAEKAQGHSAEKAQGLSTEKAQGHQLARAEKVYPSQTDYAACSPKDITTPTSSSSISTSTSSSSSNVHGNVTYSNSIFEGGGGTSAPAQDRPSLGPQCSQIRQVDQAQAQASTADVTDAEEEHDIHVQGHVRANTGHATSSANSRAWGHHQQQQQQQEAAALATEVRRQLYQPLQLQLQAMTALLDQQLLRRTRSTSLAGAQGAIPTWVDLCAEALPNGFDPLFTCQQAQSLFRVMELRGRFVGYPVAWVLATAAWTQHGLDKDPLAPMAWRRLRSLVFEGMQEARSLGQIPLPLRAGDGAAGRAAGSVASQGGGSQPAGAASRAEGVDGQKPQGKGASAGPKAGDEELWHGALDAAWLQEIVGPERAWPVMDVGPQRTHDAAAHEDGKHEQPGNLKLAVPMYLDVDASTFRVCM